MTHQASQLKKFAMEAGLWLIALPASLNFLSFSQYDLPLSAWLRRVLLNFENTSALVWTNVLGDGARGPREHLFLTFTLVMFVPAGLWLIYRLVRPRTATMSGADALWYFLTMVSITAIFSAMVGKFSGALSLVVLFMGTLFLANLVRLGHGGSTEWKRRLVPDGGSATFSGRWAPYVIFLGIEAFLLSTYSEMPQCLRGRPSMFGPWLSSFL